MLVIGHNKTGTTSLKEALTTLGYRVGNQRTAELLMEDWGKRDFRRLIRYCHSADAFQDVPFSYHYTFQALDAAFPGSKFILSVRGSADEWYQSVVRFHSKRLEKRTGENRIQHSMTYAKIPMCIQATSGASARSSVLRRGARNLILKTH